MFTQDSRDKPENDRCRRRRLSVYCNVFKRMYHSGSSANELSLKAKDDVSGWGGGLWLSVFNASAFNVILATTPCWLWSARIHNVIANAMSMFNNTPHLALSCHSLPQGAREQISVAYGNKVMDTRLPQPVGCGDKYDVRCGVQCGRSMIEMLGVLAIIAILSVGGIAGYSKAMEKFKLNKAISEYAYLIFGLQDYIEFAHQYKSENIYNGATQIAEAAALIPQTWKILNGYSIYDAYNNRLQIYINAQTHNLVIDFYLDGMSKAEKKQYLNTFSGKLCMEIFNNIVIPLNSAITKASLFRSKNGSKVFYGQTACSTGLKCIRDMTLDDVRTTCNYCTEESSCAITLFF